MGYKMIFTGSISIFVLSLSTVWAGLNLNPGKWEITTKTEMAGMPAQSQTHTQCINKNELVPTSNDANQQCKVTDIEINGNTVSWKITCGGQGGGMSGTGTTTYEGDTLKGSMSMTITGTDMTVKNTLTGKRIGDCDEEGLE
jgi:hypothetical protein